MRFYTIDNEWYILNRIQRKSLSTTPYRMANWSSRHTEQVGTSTASGHTTCAEYLSGGITFRKPRVYTSVISEVYFLECWCSAIWTKMFRCRTLNDGRLFQFIRTNDKVNRRILLRFGGFLLLRLGQWYTFIWCLLFSVVFLYVCFILRSFWIHCVLLERRKSTSRLHVMNILTACETKNNVSTANLLSAKKDTVIIYTCVTWPIFV